MSAIYCKFKNGETLIGRIESHSGGYDDPVEEGRTTIVEWDPGKMEFSGFRVEFWDQDVFQVIYPRDDQSDKDFVSELYRLSENAKRKMEEEKKRSQEEARRQMELRGRVNRPGLIVPRVGS